jgi:outer membrane protein TolC
MKCFGLLSITAILVSCSAQQYKEQADDEVYQILKKAEKKVFGKQTDFNIATNYSSRDSESVKPSALLKRSQSGGSVTLSIEQAISYGASHSHDYQAQKERLYISALNLTGTRHTFKPQFSSRFTPTIAKESDGDKRSSIGVRQAVSQTLQSGGGYSLALANDLLRFFTGDPRRSASSIATFNILKPLLRGAGKDIAAERLTQGTRNVVYALRDYNQFQNEYSRGIVIQYLRLLQQKETVANQYTNYLSRKSNTAYLRARAVDRVSPQEVGDSEQGELQAKNSWINAKSRYQSSLDSFKLSLGMPTTTTLTLKDQELTKIEQAGLFSLQLSHSQSLKLALKHRLPLLNDIDRFEDQKRQVVIAADQLKADVNLVSTTSLRSTGNSYENFNFNKVAVDVGLQINLPINRKPERNNYRSTLIQFDASIRSLSRSYDSLQNLIQQRLREIQQFSQNYEIQKGAVELAEKRVEANKLRLQAGTLIFRRLSESQDSLISAQNAVTAALIDYQRARLEFYTDIGILNVEKKEYWLMRNPTKK